MNTKEILQGIKNWTTGKLDTKADKSSTVSNVSYDTTNKKITKTINGTTSDVVSVSTIKTDLNLSKSDIGLGNVTNDAQVKRSEMGAASGVATLDSAGKVPSSQLPSYVDDVLEYDTKSAFPATGEGGKIYVDKSNNTSWRWSGSAYTQIKGDLTIGTTSGTAADGKVVNDHMNNTSNPHSVTKAQVGLGSVVNTGDSATPVSGGTTKFTTGGAYTELNKKVDKVSGKGLSTNDYTTDDKTKLNGIATGATKVTTDTVAGWGYTKNAGTVTGVKINGTTKSPSSGVVDLGTVITAHQDISGKVNTSTKVNGHALTGDVTVTKSDVGLGNVGDFKAVSTAASQGLSNTEKANARANIGAGTSSFSGSYNDLSNKPTIPAAANNGTYTVKTLVGSTTTNVSDFTANQSSADDVTFVQGSNVTITPDATNRKITIAATDTTYSSKTAASGGTDVSLVTTGEKYTWNSKTSNTGTVTSVAVKMNGSTKGTVTTSGTIDLGTVITSHQDISGKQDKLISGTNIKTINSQSILGSGNIVIKSGGSSKSYDAEVEYLESTGYQYIDTGYVPTSNFKVEIKFSDVSSWIMGCPHYAGYSDDFGIGNSYIRFGTKYVQNITYPTNIVNVIADKNGYSINSVNTSWGGTASLSGSDSIYLFWANGSSAAKSGKIYSCKFYNGSTIVRNFIPVRVGNVGYMYDKVSGQLFGNADTGSFAFGADLNYISTAGGDITGNLNVSGNVGIGTTSPSYKLHVAGNVGATGYNNTSDIRKKDIIENLNLDVEDIAKAPIFKFSWLDPDMPDGVNIGTSAQYWQTIISEIVSEANNDEKTLSMQYGVAGLASSIAIARKVVEQEETIKAQEGRIKALEDAIVNI